MDSDRRRHPRKPQPFDGRWRGASGGSICRISDISVSGCFVQTMAEPAVGEHTVISITRRQQGDELNVPGQVRYTERGIGFGVQFDALSDELTEALKQLTPHEG